MFFRHNILGLCWLALIFLLSCMPGKEFSQMQPFSGLDKIIHFYLYFQLSLLLIIGFKKQYSYPLLRYNSVKTALLFSLFYGVFMELLQGFIFMERSIELTDIIANIAGSFWGVFIFFIIYYKINPGE
jgi:VanZ family protein